MTTVILPSVYLDNITTITGIGLYVVNTYPEADSVEAHRGANIVLDITSTVSGDSVDLSEVEIYVNDVLAVAGTVFQSGFSGSAPGGDAETLTYTINPDTDWASEQVISVRVVAQTVSTTYTLDTTYTFTVEDITTPTLVTAVALDAETVQVVFSEGMLSSSSSGSTDALNPSRYSLEFVPTTSNQAAVSASISAVEKISSTTFNLTTDIPLTFGKSYKLYGTGIADDSLAGNVVTAPNDYVSFVSWSPPRWREIQFIDVYNWYARHHREQDITGDLEKWCSVIQDVVDWMWWDAWRMNTIWDIDNADEYYLDLKLADLGNPFQFDLTVRQKRDLIELLVSFYQKKGTATGILALADFFTDVTITEIREWNGTTWSLGESELGIDTDLGPSGQAELYSFEVVVDSVLSDEDRQTLLTLIDFMKPAHTHAYLVEPGDSGFIDHWDLGLSELGENTLLH